MSSPAEDAKQFNQENGVGADGATKFFLGARSALKIGDMKAAERLLRHALELSPNNYNYQLALARLLIQADKDLTEAEALLLQANTINVTAVEPRLILATMYEKAGRLELTRAILIGVLNIDENNFSARRKLNQLNTPLVVEELAGTRAHLFGELAQIAEAITSLSDHQAASVGSGNHRDGRSLAEVMLPVDHDTLLDFGDTSSAASTAVEPAAAPEEAPLLDETKLELELNNNFKFDTADIEVASFMASLAIVEAIRTEIEERLPHFGPELAEPEIEPLPLRIDVDEMGEKAQAALVTLDVTRVIDIMRKFFYAVEAEVGRDTAFLLLRRAKGQIEALYPSLDNFEIVEDFKIIEFACNDLFISLRTLQALVVWMYLYVTLLSETAISPEARNRVLEAALPTTTGMAELLFITEFTSIQI